MSKCPDCLDSELIYYPDEEALYCESCGFSITTKTDKEPKYIQ